MPGRFPDPRRFWKWPEAIRLALLAGLLNRSEAIVSVAISAGSPWHDRRGRCCRQGAATVAWLVKRTGLSERAVWYAIHGSSGEKNRKARPGLLAWLDKDRQGRYTWKHEHLRTFARVTPEELTALGKRPHLDVIKLWAWAAGKLSRGRPFITWPWVPAEAAAALGWDAGRAQRAYDGAADRLGAVAAGLLEAVNGFLRCKVPTAAAVERAGSTCGKPSAQPVDPRSVCAGASRVGELFQNCTLPIGRVLVVDLLHRWQEKVAAEGRDPFDVPAASEWLNGWRVRRERLRGWAASVVRLCLLATPFAATAGQERPACASRSPGSRHRGRAGPPGMVPASEGGRAGL